MNSVQECGNLSNGLESLKNQPFMKLVKFGCFGKLFLGSEGLDLSDRY